MTTSPDVETLSRDLIELAARPGTNRDRMAAFLVEERGVARPDAEAIARSVCEGLLATRFPAITQIELLLTEDCNQRCDYCFVDGKNTVHRMSEEVAFDAVRFLVRHSRDRKDVRILFFGGEPLLEFDLMQRVVALAERETAAAGKTIKFSITTNGTLLDEPMCRFMADHSIPVLLSVDGVKEDHDRHRPMAGGGSSYERVAARIPIIKRYQPWLGSRVTVAPDAVPRLQSNVQHLADLGINQFLIGPATGVPWRDADLAAYRDGMIAVITWVAGEVARGRPLRVVLLEEDLDNFRSRRALWGCRAGRHSLTVTWDGGLYPCSKMLGVSGLKGIMPLGSLAEGMTEIYNRLALCGRVPIERAQCEACDMADCCMGGCFATNFQETGSVFQPSSLDCRLRRIVTEIVEATDHLVQRRSGGGALESDGPERIVGDA